MCPLCETANQADVYVVPRFSLLPCVRIKLLLNPGLSTEVGLTSFPAPGVGGTMFGDQAAQSYLKCLVCFKSTFVLPEMPSLPDQSGVVRSSQAESPGWMGGERGGNWETEVQGQKLGPH